MNATNFLTRRILGMDYRVWGAMLLVCFLCLGLYGYKQIRYNINNDQPCPTDTITVNGKSVEVVGSCYLDRISSFKLQSETAATVEWNFGDGTNMVRGIVVSHGFKQEGSYFVTATVNGRCKFNAEIEVIDDPFLSGNQKNPHVEIYADPMHPAQGGTVKFYCVADMPFITSYEWKVSETNEVQKDSVPAFTFNNAGKYTIQLVVNGDLSTETMKRIEVTAEIPQAQATSGNNGPGAVMPSDIGPLGNLVPPGGTPSNASNAPQANNSPTNNDQGTPKSPLDTARVVPSPGVPEVDPNAFMGLLQDVVDQKGKEPEDLYKYLYYRETVKVKVNESESLIPLPEFCRNMRKKNRRMRKIESLSFQRDDTKNIQVIKVKVPEKGFWDKFNPF
jgi:PKD repeat protein